MSLSIIILKIIRIAEISFGYIMISPAIYIIILFFLDNITFDRYEPIINERLKLHGLVNLSFIDGQFFEKYPNLLNYQNELKRQILEERDTEEYFILKGEPLLLIFFAITAIVGAYLIKRPKTE